MSERIFDRSKRLLSPGTPMKGLELEELERTAAFAKWMNKNGSRKKARGRRDVGDGFGLDGCSKSAHDSSSHPCFKSLLQGDRLSVEFAKHIKVSSYIECQGMLRSPWLTAMRA